LQRHLRRHAVAEGIDFPPRSLSTLLVNTHRALAASVYCQEREPERFEAFHHAIFRACLCEDRNIGEPSVLRDLARAVGLDVTRMEDALDAETAAGDLQAAAGEAQRHRITAVPAFVFGERFVVVGAHPTAALVQAAEQAAAAGRPAPGPD